MKHTTASRGRWALLALLLLGLSGTALADAPAAILAKYEKQAGAKGNPERGMALFSQDFKQTLGWTCSSCHTANPLQGGTDQMKEKPLAPLAPAANPKRLTDPEKVENAFRLNCPDVVGRKCSAQEKADVLAWLISLKKD